MQDIIYNRIRNEASGGGLLVLAPACGSGKTYSATHAMARAILEEEDGGVPWELRTRFVFATPNKNNLADRRKLRALLVDAGRPHLAKSVLFARGGVDAMRRVVDGDGRSAFDVAKSMMHESQFARSRVLESDECASALADLERYVDKTEKDPDIAAMVEGVVSTAESRLRASVRKAIAGYFKTPFAAQAALDTPELAWVRVLWQNVDFHDALAVYMSAAKALLTIDPVVSPQFRLWDSSAPRSHVVVLDEYDSCMGAWNDLLLESALKRDFELLGTVKTVSGRLALDEFERDLFLDGRGLANRESAWMKERFEQLRATVGATVAKYNLQRDFTLSSGAGAREHFLFRAQDSCSLLSGGDGALAVATNTEEARAFVYERNVIGRPGEVTPRGPGSSTLRLTSMIGQLNGVLGLIAVTLGTFAQRNAEARERLARAAEEDDLRFSNVPTVQSLFVSYLAHLGIGEEHGAKGALVDLWLSLQRSDARRAPDDDLELSDTSYYARGLSFASIDPPGGEHAFTTELRSVNAALTPERVLLGLSSCHYVVGLSATGEVPTVLANFDDDWISAKLKDRRRRLTEEERQALAEHVKESQKHYDRVDVRAELVSSANADGECDVSVWRRAIDDDAGALAAFNLVSANASKHDVPLYYKCAWCWRKFVEDPDFRSFIFFTNKSLRDKGPFSREVLVRTLAFVEMDVARAKGVAVSYDDAVRAVDGTLVGLSNRQKTYEADLAAVKERWAAGGKAFVVTAFGSAATGQNFQYRTPRALVDAGKVVVVNDWGVRDEKDVDGIFIDKPTNVVTNIWRKWKGAERFKLLAKSLVETARLYEHGEISPVARWNLVKRAFRNASHNGGAGDGPNHFKPTESYQGSVYTTVNQTAGRISRSNVKSPVVRVYAAEDVLADVTGSFAESVDSVPTREFAALLDACRLVSEEPDAAEKRAVTRVLVVDDRCRHRILNMVEGGFANERQRQEWRTLRELSLKRPTALQGEETSFTNVCHVTLPKSAARMWYSTEGDFERNTEIYFRKPTSARGGKLVREVSSRAAGLDDMMRVRGLKEHFTKNGFAVEWEAGVHLLAPYVFKSVYKGALGEIAGAWSIENFTAGSGLPLEFGEVTVEGGYEKMDAEFVLAGEKTGCFIDFKNWSGEPEEFGRLEKETERYVAKGTALGTKLCVIANVLPSAPGAKCSLRAVGDGLVLLTVPNLVREAGDGTFVSDFENIDLIWKQVVACANKQTSAQRS